MAYGDILNISAYDKIRWNAYVPMGSGSPEMFCASIRLPSFIPPRSPFLGRRF